MQLNEQKEMQKITTRIRVLEQEVSELRDEEALLEKKYLAVVEES